MMKQKNLFLLSGFVLVLVAAAAAISYTDSSANEPSAQEIKWNSFDEGLGQASAQNKKLLVDVYTDWCTWCKKMDAEVYTDPEVASILNTRFVAVKINAESDARLSYEDRVYTSAQFSQALGISGYPSTVFFRPDGKPITLVPGYIDAKKFASILDYIGNDYYQTMSFDEFQSRSSSTD